MIKFCSSNKIDIFKIKDFYCKYATWGVTNSYDDWKTIIENSNCIITVWDNDKLIGMSRALSDGVRWATIVDVLIHPNYRSNQIGSMMIKKLMELDKMQVRTIYLATADKENFYNRLGFKTVNENCYYMVKVNKIVESKYFTPVNN
ncbi:N-acetyltransferase GCN5 [[Clostridium] sordellii]|uniref:GNAT family N-acetyltransferase n=1 Tax=Paraclostridium sordellii TaxID=1505 RepID=UPI0005E7B9C7|nr:GNAT family N-acetyltransferase [Paeniclostridium sordellii]MDU1453983.1 GNAT family N-acetyltransferase [Paeniclostridium sordellii]MDU4413304.1 GNAT family N-acetyltransferase [Paeniclostridium sordellii]MDU6113602.1 GNAT family N-acetyltransferase [Paeniclostridium sordellii]MRZ29049.1 GNAT family N-acetyltransferase [Paeniclostridium sordellii]MVO75157.1 GNAT family N-acetyltransferase [Paeniclostridium sordellii]